MDKDKIKKTIAEQLNVTHFPFIAKDSKGNIIYLEHTSYDWFKNEYDSNGNNIYFETSKGDWFKREYDSKGNIIYHEDSNGVIEDNRSIPEYTMEELTKKIGNFKLKK